MTYQKHLSFIFSILLFSSFYQLSFAQKDAVKVSAQIEVLMEGNYSKTQIKEKAIQAAKIKAMGDEFGYAIIQGINTQTKSISGDKIQTISSINEVSNTEVKGEWIADDKGFPKTKFVVRDKEDDQEIWLICEVKGKARKIEQANVAFETFTFNCNEPEKCPTGQLKSGDSMFLYFKSPVGGYLSVFMLEDGWIYRLLPYAQMKNEYESAAPVLADTKYLLFHPQYRDYFENFKSVDEYGLETREDGEPLSNLVFVIFSTEPFKKPVMEENEGLKRMDLPKFQEWLNRNKGLDKNFQVSKLSVVVNK